MKNETLDVRIKCGDEEFLGRCMSWGLQVAVAPDGAVYPEYWTAAEVQEAAAKIYTGMLSPWADLWQEATRALWALREVVCLLQHCCKTKDGQAALVDAAKMFQHEAFTCTARLVAKVSGRTDGIRILLAPPGSRYMKSKP